MTDLQDRLTRLAPEVDTEATLVGLHGRARRDVRRRRAVVGSVAVVTILGAAVAAVALDRTDGGHDRVTDPVTVDGQWRALADPPFGQAFVEEGRVWTGDEVLVLGHRGSNDSGGTSWGAAYDPDHDTWRTITRSPLAARSNPVVAWSGEELLVWGGDPLALAPYEENGAAYDPATDTWRIIARAPIEARGVANGALVDGELVVVGGRRVDGAPVDCVVDPCLPSGRHLRDGAAYDPESDSWRRIADLPVVVGQYAETTTADGELRIFHPLRSFAYDVSNDRWRELSRRRTDGGRLTGVGFMRAAGGTAVVLDQSFRVVNVDGDGDGMIDERDLRPNPDRWFLYRPELDRWEPAPRSISGARATGRCGSSVTGVDQVLVVAGCAFAEVDVATGEWTSIDPPAADGVGRPDLFLMLAGEGVGGDGEIYLSITGFGATTGPIRPGDRDDVPGFVAYELPG